MDGTFKECPELFYQLYTVHVTIQGYNPPCIYVLLPNKTEKSYNRLAAALQNLAPLSNPQRILMDFEKAAMNAFSKQFPNCQISGCYFHLCQSLNRKVSTVGLKTEYESHSELALALRLMPALAYVPLSDVCGTFDLVIDEVTTVLDYLDLGDDVIEKVDQVTSYFQNTYVRGQQIGTTNRPPMYPPPIWNQSDAANEGVVRTNNAVEGWHYGLQSLFQGSHPNMWTFLGKLKKDASVHKFNVIQAMAGRDNPSRKRYALLNETVVKMRRSYNPRTPINYLRALAHLQ